MPQSRLSSRPGRRSRPLRRPAGGSSTRAGLGLAVALGLLVGGARVAQAAPPGPPKRGNSVLGKPLTAPVISVAAAARMGVLIGNGGVVIQPPLGFGFAFDLRYHALAIGGGRLGVQLTAGHDRFPGRNTFPVENADGTTTQVPRYTILGHTDITAGPSLQVPLRVLFIEGGVSGGLAISSFRRPRSLDPADDDEVVGYDGMIRGDLALAVPIRNNQGIRLGADVVKIFSKKWIVADPQAPVDAAPDTAIFDLYLDVVLAYQMWF